MTRNILFLLVSIVLTGISFSQNKLVVYGSLWERGFESKCNWYFSGENAVMELVYNLDGQQVITRLGMQKSSSFLVIETNKGGNISCVKIHADSISGESGVMNFVRNGSPKEFDGFGSCPRAQFRSHTSEFLVFTFNDNAIKLSNFKKFIKNDPAFQWIASGTTNEFPVQSLMTQSDGTLLRSYMALSKSASFDDSIFGFISSCQ
jgi:hypothetical protein